jgi:hypothetical protein
LSAFQLSKLVVFSCCLHPLHCTRCVNECTLFQVAYSAIFNPTLPKSARGDGLPLMLRDAKGVSDFELRFLQDKQVD